MANLTLFIEITGKMDLFGIWKTDIARFYDLQTSHRYSIDDYVQEDDLIGIEQWVTCVYGLKSEVTQLLRRRRLGSPSFLFRGWNEITIGKFKEPRKENCESFEETLRKWSVRTPAILLILFQLNYLNVRGEKITPKGTIIKSPRSCSNSLQSVLVSLNRVTL